MKILKTAILLLSVLSLGLLAVSCSDDEKSTGSDTFKYNYTITDENEAIITSYSGKPELLAIPEEIDGYPVVAIGDGAFFNCTTATAVEIPEGVREIGSRSFENCKSITSVTIPSTVNTIGSSAFNGCINLSDLSISNGSALNYVGENAFRSCRMLNSTTDEGAVYLKAGSNDHGILLSAESSSITSVKIHEDTEIIVGGAFSGCTSLTEITLPKGLRSIGDKAFSGCINLDKIYFNSVLLNDLKAGSAVFEKVATKSQTMTLFVGEEVTRIPAYLMDSATRLRVLEFADESVCRSIGAYAFAGTPLPDITIPEGLQVIEEGAFSKCTWLKSITLEAEDLADFAQNNSIFTDAGIDDENTTHTFTVTISGSVERIPAYFLSSANDVAEVIFKDNSRLKAIGKDAFAGCDDITKVKILDKLAWCTTRFESEKSNPLYYGNTYMYIGDSNTPITGLILDGAEYISDYAFIGYKHLDKIIIPIELKSIGASAFEGAKNLATVYYEGTADEWAEISISSGNSQLDSCKIYFYCEDVPTELGNFWRYNNGTPEIWSYNAVN